MGAKVQVTLCVDLYRHRQLGKRVLFILVFLLENLWARKDVVFYGINCFFRPQITIACENYTSHVNKNQPIERFD